MLAYSSTFIIIVFKKYKNFKHIYGEKQYLVKFIFVFQVLDRYSIYFERTREKNKRKTFNMSLLIVLFTFFIFHDSI